MGRPPVLRPQLRRDSLGSRAQPSVPPAGPTERHVDPPPPGRRPCQQHRLCCGSPITSGWTPNRTARRTARTRFPARPLHDTPRLARRDPQAPRPGDPGPTSDHRVAGLSLSCCRGPGRLAAEHRQRECPCPPRLSGGAVRSSVSVPDAGCRASPGRLHHAAIPHVAAHAGHHADRAVWLPEHLGSPTDGAAVMKRLPNQRLQLSGAAK